MATQLTTVSLAVKQYGLTVLISIIGIILVWNLAKYGYETCCIKKATPTPAAYPALGQLETMKFKSPPPRSDNMRFSLETISGELPQMTSNIIPVYQVTKQRVTFDYEKQAEEIAKNIGFTNPITEQTSETTFLFTNPQDQLEQLTYNVQYKHVEYEVKNINSYVSLEKGSAPKREEAFELATNFINATRNEIFQMEQINANTQFGIKEIYYYLDPATNQQTKVESHTQANITVINLNRPPINNIPIIGPSTTEGLISFTFTGVTPSANRQSGRYRTLRAKIIFWPVNRKQQTATYPLLDIATAWAQLINGQAYVLSPKVTNETINIRRIYLGYFEAEETSKYKIPVLTPVWIFEGDKPSDINFLFRAIVPAIAPPYYDGFQEISFHSKLR